MAFVGTAYILCGILCIIACIMDGQDVKPLWKKWVSGKLEKAANYFFPIKYIIETKYIPLAPPTPWERYDYDRIDFKGEKLNVGHIITEQDMLEALSYSFCRGEDAIPLLIKERKSQCIRDLLGMITRGGYITVEEDRESRYPNILVHAWLYIGKKM